MHDIKAQEKKGRETEAEEWGGTTDEEQSAMPRETAVEVPFFF